MQPIRAAIYARISQDPRETTLGVQRQLEDCRAYCVKQGWIIASEYVDNDISAFGDKVRPEYERLLSDIKSGAVNVVVASKLDRLSRRLRTSIELCDVLLSNGVTLHDLSGETDLRTAMGITIYQLAAVMNENKVRVDQENNRRMRLQLAERGVRHMTARPYGWEADGKRVRESEAAVVREIIERLIAGDSGTRIARELNQRGIATGRGARWTGAGVKACARRASNAGLREHKGKLYEGQWEPIVTREQWERLRTVLARPVRAYRRGTGRKYPFSGFIVCGVCARPLSVAMGRSNSGTTAYRCDVKTSTGVAAVGCGGVQRSQVPIDFLIKEALIARLSDGGLETVLLDMNRTDEALDSRIAELRTKRQRLDDLVDDYASGLLTREQFARAKTIADGEVAELERTVAAMSGRVRLASADFSQGIRALIEGADLHLLRDLAELLIKEVRVYPQAKTGFRLKLFEIDGRRWRFDESLVQLEWLC